MNLDKTDGGVIKIVENPFIYTTVTREQLLEIASRPICGKPLQEWSIHNSLCLAMTKEILTIAKTTKEHILRTEDHRLYVYRFFDPTESETSGANMSYAFMGVEDIGKDPVLIAMIVVDRLRHPCNARMDFHIYLPRKRSVWAKDIDQWLRMGAGLKWVPFDNK